MSLDASRWAWQQQITPASAKLVLLAFADRADENNTCYPSLDRLIKDTCLNRKTIISSIKNLIAAGIIKDTGARIGRTKSIIKYQIVNVLDRQTAVPKTEPLNSKAVPISEPLSSTDFTKKRPKTCPKAVPKSEPLDSKAVPISEPLSSTENGTSSGSSSTDFTMKQYRYCHEAVPKTEPLSSTDIGTENLSVFLTNQGTNQGTDSARAREESFADPAKFIFDHWKKTLNHPKAKLDDKRKRLIASRLKDGYEVNDLVNAINGCATTPWNMGANDSGGKYDSIALILRDAEQVDRFINNFFHPPKPKTKADLIQSANSAAADKALIDLEKESC